MNEKMCMTGMNFRRKYSSSIRQICVKWIRCPIVGHIGYSIYRVVEGRLEPPTFMRAGGKPPHLFVISTHIFFFFF